MVDIDYSKYLDDDDSLNKGKLWSDIAGIRGFYSDQRRKDLYDAVTTWYYHHIKAKKEENNAST